MGTLKMVLKKITEVRLQITAQKDTEKPQIYECQVSKW